MSGSQSSKRAVREPGGANVLRQMGVVIIVAVVWAALFAAYLDVTRARWPAYAHGGPQEFNAPADLSNVGYASHVQPLLNRRCVKCHGGEGEQEGLVLTSYQSVLDGSFNGPVVEPGSAEDSLLVEMIADAKMPKNEPHLLPGEIRRIVAWVDAGAQEN